jgi:hypothetical protein
VFSEVAMLVGSLALIGNPVGLLDDMSSGVKDFFHEPIEGMLNHGVVGSLQVPLALPSYHRPSTCFLLSCGFMSI